MNATTEYLKQATWKCYEALELDKDVPDYIQMLERALKFYKERRYVNPR
jgi:hypothetical protein